MNHGSFVALGDSFTEGMDDLRDDGTYRGWADLVAEQLASRQSEFRYANLAVRGRLLRPILDEQLPRALEMSPDLVSLCAGGNDILRPKVDFPVLARSLDTAVAALRANGSDVLLFTGAGAAAQLPMRKRIQPKVTALNRLVRRLAVRHDAALVDLYSDVGFHDSRLWSVDRLHLNPAGHRRVAARVLAALGVEFDPEWVAPLPPASAVRWHLARADDLRWARTYLVPWIHRRLTGRSSGDNILAKRPDLSPLV